MFEDDHVTIRANTNLEMKILFGVNTFLEYSPKISQVHYHTINAQDKFFYFFYNITTLLHSKQYFQTD